MEQRELNSILKRCRDKLAPELIADAQGFFKGKEIVVAARLCEGVGFEDVGIAEEILFNEIEVALSRDQTFEIYWQLMR